MSAVKGNARKVKAAATRRRMLDAAYGLFAEQGFRATTMDAIAQRAGVAVQTLYFTFHSKDDLLQAVQDRAVLGDGEPIPPPEQPWFRAMAAERRIEGAVRQFATGIEQIASRVAPLVPAMHEVAGDPAGEVWRHSERLRRDGFADIVALWTDKASLRAGLSDARAVDVLLLLAGPASYRALVIESSWTSEEFIDWLTRSVLFDLFARTRR
jgi:AcrR family transcriptional regulator